MNLSKVRTIFLNPFTIWVYKVPFFDLVYYLRFISVVIISDIKNKSVIFNH